MTRPVKAALLSAAMLGFVAAVMGGIYALIVLFGHATAVLVLGAVGIVATVIFGACSIVYEWPTGHAGLPPPPLPSSSVFGRWIPNEEVDPATNIWDRYYSTESGDIFKYTGEPVLRGVKWWFPDDPLDTRRPKV